MNRVTLLGNLTKTPELQTTQNGTPFCKFTVACQRKFKNKDGRRDADFVFCTAWRQKAELVVKYFVKGQKILVEGSIQTGSYEDQNGQRIFTTDVVVDNVEFAGGNSSAATPQEHGVPSSAGRRMPSDPVWGDDIEDMEPLDDGDLPF